MPTGLADIVYYDTNPVRPYLDYYCPIIEDTPEEDVVPEQVPAAAPTLQRTIIPSPRPSRVRPYVLAHFQTHSGQLAFPLAPADELSHGYAGKEPIEEEYTPERLERLATAHADAKQRSGGFRSTADPDLLRALIEGLKRL